MPLVAAQSMSQAATGFGLQHDFGTAGSVRHKVKASALFDLVVPPPARLAEVVAQGLVVSAGRASLRVVSLGIAVRRGAPKPAVATEADIKAALAEASRISLADPASGATTGLYFAKLLKEMGLDETLKPKIRLFADGTAALAGPLPETLQLRTVYAAGVAKKARAPHAARAMIAFLTSPRMAPALSAAGFDLPGSAAKAADTPTPDLK